MRSEMAIAGVEVVKHKSREWTLDADADDAQSVPLSLANPQTYRAGTSPAPLGRDGRAQVEAIGAVEADGKLASSRHLRRRRSHQDCYRQYHRRRQEP